MRFLLSCSLLAVVFCAGCASQSSGPSASSSSESSEPATGLPAPWQPGPAASFQRADGADPFIQAPTMRPGAGDVVMGETHVSRRVPTSFVRAKGDSPMAEMVVHYLNEEGAGTLAGSHRLPRAADAARADLGGGYVSLNVRERLRGPLPLLSAQDGHYVVVKPGHQAFLTVRNTLRSPVEVLVTVDGRALTDNQPSSYHKRGYVIDPGDTASVGVQFDQARGQISMAVFLPAGIR